MTLDLTMIHLRKLGTAHGPSLAAATRAGLGFSASLSKRVQTRNPPSDAALATTVAELYRLWETSTTFVPEPNTVKVDPKVRGESFRSA
jgi:hypothetical protein